MIQTININSFREAFTTSNRKDNFSCDGLGYLFDYLEEIDEAMQEPLELDPIAFCCEFTEYSSVKELICQHTIEIDDDTEEDEMEDIVREYIENETSIVCWEPNCIIIRQF